MIRVKRELESIELYDETSEGIVYETHLSMYDAIALSCELLAAIKPAYERTMYERAKKASKK